MAMIRLENLEDTARLGKLLAQNISARDAPALFMKGDLGCGKTTLVRHLVQNLPGGEQAEISSPSFTVCNQYQASPEVLHCDLYRCRDSFPEDIYEALDRRGCLVIMEWAEFFPPDALPGDYVEICFSIGNNARLLALAGHGRGGRKLVKNLEQSWNAAASAKQAARPDE